MQRPVAMAAVLMIGLAGCGSPSVSTLESGSTSTVAAATTTAPAETTTSVPATDAPTTPTTSTPVVVSEGWVPLPVEELTGQVAYPCCGSNWYGDPSPPLPMPGTTLADAIYFAPVVWPDDPTQPLELQLYRFERCSALPENLCEFYDSYDDTDLGVDDSESFPLTLPLDGELRVVLVGFRGFGDGGEPPTPAAEGRGPDLAELAVAVDKAYAELLTAPFEAGVDTEAIIADLSANPRGGFGPGLDGSPLSLSFEYADAPPLLFQAPFQRLDDGPLAPGRGTDGLQVVSLQVVAGQLTLYVFAGFYS